MVGTESLQFERGPINASAKADGTGQVPRREEGQGTSNVRYLMLKIPDFFQSSPSKKENGFWFPETERNPYNSKEENRTKHC